MTTRRKTRALVAAAASLSLLLAACGTRLDHQTIAQAAQTAESQTDGGLGTSDQPLGADSQAPGAAPGEAGEAGDGAAKNGTGQSPGKPGAGRTGTAQQSGSAGPSRPGGTGGGPIVIGSVGTYSGPVGVVFAQAPRALQAWAAATNAKGGLNGRPVKVIVMDDGGDAAKSKSQVQELVERHKVVALVTPMPLTNSRKAWQGYIEAKRIPAIGGPCNGGWHDSPMLFSHCPSPDSYAYGTVAAGAKYGKGKKFGGLFCTEDPICGYIEDLWFTKGYAKRAGLDPKYRAKISLTQPDFTAECIQARNAGVELFHVMGDANTVARAASSCRRQNFNPQYLQLGPSVDGNTAAKPGLDGAIVTEFTFPFAGLATAAFKEFEGAWTKYVGGRPGPAATQGWAAAKIFEATAKSAGTITSESLVKKLYTYRNERFGGLTVPLTYTPKGTVDSKCLFLMRIQGGRWVAPNGDKPSCS